MRLRSAPRRKVVRRQAGLSRLICRNWGALIVRNQRMARLKTGRRRPGSRRSCPPARFLMGGVFAQNFSESVTSEMLENSYLLARTYLKIA
jgi:hypothetical protein